MVIRSNRWFGGRPDADRLNNYRVTMQLVNGYFGLIAREPSIHLPSVCESEIEESESQDSDSSSSHGHHSRGRHSRGSGSSDSDRSHGHQATATTFTDTILVDTTPSGSVTVTILVDTTPEESSDSDRSHGHRHHRGGRGSGRGGHHHRGRPGHIHGQYRGAISTSDHSHGHHSRGRHPYSSLHHPKGDLVMDSISNIDKTHILPTIRVQGFPCEQPTTPALSTRRPTTTKFTTSKTNIVYSINGRSRVLGQFIKCFNREIAWLRSSLS